MGRWLNQFVARVEPDEQDERIHRSLADRYVSVRTDLDGVSSLNAALSSLDAAAIDRVLTAITAVADPGDTRTLQQRRADALVDVLLGRISNGCHARWDDEEAYTIDDQTDKETAADDDEADADADADLHPDRGTGGADTADVTTDVTADVDDRDLPASACRPDPPRNGAGRGIPGPTPGHPPATGPIPGSTAGTTACTCGGRSTPPPPAGVQIRPVQVTIGIIISAAAPFGFTNTPGQLADRSALIPADTIRDLAAQPGTLFHRLVTDNGGNLLDVTELGRFPSRKLTLAVGYRDGVCNTDTGHVSATRGDIDHIIPIPEGPTTASNLKARCRNDHRAKTHAGHQTEHLQHGNPRRHAGGVSRSPQTRVRTEHFVDALARRPAA